MFHLICYLLTFQIVCCTAQITQVETMEEVMSYFDQADCETLAIFDIDLVLVQPSDPAFQMPNIQKHKQIARKIIQSLPSEKLDIFLTLMALSSDSMLIDQKTPYYLKNLTQKRIPTIALTSNLTGSLGEIESLECWKITRLRKLGIDFSVSAPIATNTTFCDLPTYRGYYSNYVEGVLFANGDVSKGEVLADFLAWGSLSPKKIIFIDDRLENLQNVEEALSAYNPSICFKGIQYTGANTYPSREIDADSFQAKWVALAKRAKCL